jgi:G protein-coupled receptor 133
VCIAVGVVLHYIFLAAFMWMAVEGHHLYRLVIRVFDSGRDLFRIYLIVAYGIPLIIVGVTGIIALTSADKVYGADGL